MSQQPSPVLKPDNEMIRPQTWDDFRSSGMLFLINTILHVFGWAVVVKLNDDGKVVECYPCRVKYRGFGADAQTVGHQLIAKYMKNNADTLFEETKL